MVIGPNGEFKGYFRLGLVDSYTELDDGWDGEVEMETIQIHHSLKLLIQIARFSHIREIRDPQMPIYYEIDQ